MTIGFLSHLDLNLYLFRLPIMKKLVEQGHTVYAICPRGDKFELFERDGIQAVAYKIQRSSLNPLKELKAVYNIYRAIKPLELEMIHTFTAKPNIYGTVAAKMAKIPKIINLVEGLGSFYIEDSPKNIMVRTLIEKLYKLVFSFSDKVIFVNSDDPKYLASKRVIAKDKIHIIKSVGIDTQVFNPNNVKKETVQVLRKKLDLVNKTVVLMVARAIWHKGVREFYEAASLLSHYPNVQFILVGEIDEGNPSSANKAFLQTGDVLWMGHRDDVLELTAMSDIYVLPSYREGVPRTLLEAASMAKPIVTTNTVGCREVVKNGENGFLVPIQDSESLAEKIEYLLKHEDERKIMGENGRIMAINEFDVKNVVHQYITLYEALKMREENETNK
ncbi:MAG: Alpha-1,3-N-acetylgalactosamine transferase PglA (EC [uncultured Sulfurovum sp.]|uniref:Alpha-1,3-N-acetylgalactosamine transferase PglA (EC) n=1 Tax=uncultured Sulfurovum sp. TaxID=269237 RepID=A0A6S6T8T3_9BACT|nr:MAG: Alpha-1,3-N-acetylgalactosamine transferase PglA (EC [uncultured Sulfurovum sp.]